MGHGKKKRSAKKKEKKSKQPNYERLPYDVALIGKQAYDAVNSGDMRLAADLFWKGTEQLGESDGWYRHRHEYFSSYIAALNNSFLRSGVLDDERSKKELRENPRALTSRLVEEDYIGSNKDIATFERWFVW